MSEEKSTMLDTSTTSNEEEPKIKQLPLEARHSICLEIAKKRRQSVATSIFIPKERSRRLRWLRASQRRDKSTLLNKTHMFSQSAMYKKKFGKRKNTKSKCIKSSKAINLENTALLHPESFPIVRQTVTSERIRNVVESLRERNEDENEIIQTESDDSMDAEKVLDMPTLDTSYNSNTTGNDNDDSVATEQFLKHSADNDDNVATEKFIEQSSSAYDVMCKPEPTVSYVVVETHNKDDDVSFYETDYAVFEKEVQHTSESIAKQQNDEGLAVGDAQLEQYGYLRTAESCTKEYANCGNIGGIDTAYAQRSTEETARINYEISIPINYYYNEQPRERANHPQQTLPPTRDFYQPPTTEFIPTSVQAENHYGYLQASSERFASPHSNESCCSLACRPQNTKVPEMPLYAAAEYQRYLQAIQSKQRELLPSVISYHSRQQTTLAAQPHHQPQHFQSPQPPPLPPPQVSLPPPYPTISQQSHQPYAAQPHIPQNNSYIPYRREPSAPMPPQTPRTSYNPNFAIHAPSHPYDVPAPTNLCLSREALYSQQPYNPPSEQYQRFTCLSSYYKTSRRRRSSRRTSQYYSNEHVEHYPTSIPNYQTLPPNIVSEPMPSNGPIDLTVRHTRITPNYSHYDDPFYADYAPYITPPPAHPQLISSNHPIVTTAYATPAHMPPPANNWSPYLPPQQPTGNISYAQQHYLPFPRHA